MARVGASQVVSFSRVPSLAEHLEADVLAQKQPADGLTGESIESLRARCRAAEHAASAASAEAARARAEMLRIRHVSQQMLDATALEVLELKRELQARDRAALNQRSDASESPAQRHSSAASRSTISSEDEIAFDEIEAVLAASPVCS